MFFGDCERFFRVVTYFLSVVNIFEDCERFSR